MAFKRHHHYDQQQELPTTDLVVRGVHVMLFDDDAALSFVNSPAALMPWNGDQSLVIDRYDVRHLLHDLSGVRKRRPAPPLVDASEEELNQERYRDLDIDQDTESVKECLAPDGKDYGSVQYSYMEKPMDSGSPTKSGSNGNSSFVPPFPIPAFLQLKLPPSQKLHQIIAGTAKFVATHGGQSEIILKVKQGNNPLFGFLNADHHLNEYYRYLMNNRHLLEGTQREGRGSADVVSNSAEALSLLGTAYGADDEDDDMDYEASELTKSFRRESSLESECKPSVDVQLPSQIEKLSKNGMRMTPDLSNVRPTIGQVNSRRSPSQDQSRSGSSEPRTTSKILPDIRRKFCVDKKEFLKPSPSSGSVFPKADVKALADQSSHSIDYGMSVDAVAAVVMAATRGFGRATPGATDKRAASLEFSGRPQIFQNGIGNGSVVVTPQADGQTGKAVSDAAGSEVSSKDSHLTPAEKLKAERLRKAKIFVSMIKSGEISSEVAKEPVLLGANISAGALSHMPAVNSNSYKGESTYVKQEHLHPTVVEVGNTGHDANHAPERVEDKECDRPGRRLGTAGLSGDRKGYKHDDSDAPHGKRHPESSDLHNGNEVEINKASHHKRRKSHRYPESNREEKHRSIKHSDSSDTDGFQSYRKHRSSNYDTEDEKKRRHRHRHGADKEWGKRSRKDRYLRSSSAETEVEKSKHRRKHRGHNSTSPDGDGKLKHDGDRHHKSSSPSSGDEKRSRSYRHHQSSSSNSEEERSKRSPDMGEEKSRKQRHHWSPRLDTGDVIKTGKYKHCLSSASGTGDRKDTHGSLSLIGTRSCIHRQEERKHPFGAKMSIDQYIEGSDNLSVAEKAVDANESKSGEDVPVDIRLKVRAMLLSNLL